MYVPMCRRALRLGLPTSFGPATGLSAARLPVTESDQCAVACRDVQWCWVVAPQQAGLRQARAEFRGVAADLAIRAAEKLIRTNLDDATQRRLVEDYLVDLERSGSTGSQAS